MWNRSRATVGLRSSGLLWTMWLARSMQLPCSSGRRFLLLSLRLFSPSAAGRGDAPAPPGGPAHFMVDYLVSSCGLSRPEALRASSRLTHLKSRGNPDAVLRLLRQAGMCDDEIRRTVQRYPKVLVVKTDRTLEPRIRVLQDAGFSSSEVAQLISTNPSIIHVRDLRHRVEFWSKVIGTNENVVKAAKRAPSLLRFNLKSTVIPRIALLGDLGVPDDMMGKMFVRKPKWITIKSEWIKALVVQVKGLGFTPGTPMFVQALLSLSNLSRSTMEAKSKLLRSYGWTQAQLTYAIHRFPIILAYSEKRTRATMSFLLNEAGCEPSYVARNPSLVGFSIEKRLVPRNHVMQSLRKVGLSSKVKDFYKTVVMPDHKFVQKVIIPYKDQLPELPEAYHAFLSSQAKD